MVDKRYLTWRNKIGYGSGDIAGNMVYAFLSTFLMFYLTDTMGMNVGVVGTLMAISKLLDSITDLICGSLIDATASKLGKARPWMLFGYIGCAVLLAATFMIPTAWGTTAQYAYFFITYTLLNAVFYTANNIAYATLTALITKNTSERVQLGSILYMFAFITTMLIQTGTMDAIIRFGNDAAAWKMIAMIYGFLGLAANTISVFSVMELPQEELYMTDFGKVDIPKKNHTPSEAAALLLKNPFFILVCGVYFLSQICQSALGMGVYFMKYALGDEALLKYFSLFTNLPLILGLIATPWLVRKLRGMYKLNIAGFALAAAGRLSVLISAYLGSIPAMLVFTGLAALGTSPLHGDLNALIASCSEYTFLSHGKRIDGSMYSCASFGIKAGASLGTAISGWLMAAAGYIESAPIQTADTISMLHILYLWAPVVLNAAITILLIHLNVEKANEKLWAGKKYLRFF